MKPYYTKKGKYEDGRNKIAIEYIKENKIIVKFLPKPEKMLEILKKVSPVSLRVKR